MFELTSQTKAVLLLAAMLSSSKGQAAGLQSDVSRSGEGSCAAVPVTGGSLVAEEFHTAVRPRECLSTLRTGIFRGAGACVILKEIQNPGFLRLMYLGSVCQ